MSLEIDQGTTGDYCTYIKCANCGGQSLAQKVKTSEGDKYISLHTQEQCLNALIGYRIACNEIIGGLIKILTEMLDEFNKDYKCPHCSKMMRTGDFEPHLRLKHPDVTFGHDKI